MCQFAGWYPASASTPVTRAYTSSSVLSTCEKPHVDSFRYRMISIVLSGRLSYVSSALFRSTRSLYPTAAISSRRSFRRPFASASEFTRGVDSRNLTLTTSPHLRSPSRTQVSRIACRFRREPIEQHVLVTTISIRICEPSVPRGHRSSSASAALSPASRASRLPTAKSTCETFRAVTLSFPTRMSSGSRMIRSWIMSFSESAGGKSSAISVWYLDRSRASMYVAETAHTKSATPASFLRTRRPRPRLPVSWSAYPSMRAPLLAFAKVARLFARNIRPRSRAPRSDGSRSGRTPAPGGTGAPPARGRHSDSQMHR